MDKITSVFLQLLKETTIRSGEASRIKWTDIDFTPGTVQIQPEKRSNPRIFNISNKLIAMLNGLQQRSEKVFVPHLASYIRKTFERQRKRIAIKLGNLRLDRITFHTFRHWKATMLYHQTKDVLYVMQFLGHKNINNTMIYVQLEEALYKKQNEEFTYKVASTLNEMKELIEAGFEYICEFNGAKVFRKRK